MMDADSNDDDIETYRRTRSAAWRWTSWVANAEEKRAALTAFTKVYADDGADPRFTDDTLDAVVVVKFNIDELSGKQHLASQR